MWPSVARKTWSAISIRSAKMKSLDLQTLSSSQLSGHDTLQIMITLYSCQLVLLAFLLSYTSDIVMKEDGREYPCGTCGSQLPGNRENTELNDLRKKYLFEKICVFYFIQISTGMRDEHLRSMACIACHCRNEYTVRLP